MTEPVSLRLLGIAGSLRAGSFNAMALRAAREALPAGIAMEILEWRDVPPFDADVLAAGMPAPVVRVREAIREADGLVIATPEYNFSIPGMLKNLIDWVSRGDDQPLKRKPVAILSAATGPLGGARVQYDLRKVLLFVDAMVLQKPEVFIGQAAGKFDADGRCTDAQTLGFAAAQMQAFSAWIEELGRMSKGLPAEPSRRP